jgi:hypothetical protein
MRARALAAWGGPIVAIALATRAIVYALAPHSLQALRLGARLGGPRPVYVIAAALLAGGALAALLLWLACLGVRERWALDAPETRGARPRLALGRFAARAAGLWVGSSLAFAALESYEHVRAGLGFHGLACLIGPVHVDALPVTAGLALVVAAIVAAVEHALRWARRVVARVLGARPRPARPRLVHLGVPRERRAVPSVLVVEPLLPRPPPFALAATSI